MASKVRLRYTRPPWLYPLQLVLFGPERYVACEASTKSGKTLACLCWLLEQAIGRGGEGREFWWVAPTHRQARIAFRRLRLYLARMAVRVRVAPAALYSHNGSEQTITLSNGSTMSFLSGEVPDNLYGEDVHAAVIDEASRCREEAWHAVRSTLTHTGGPIRVIGNVRGRRNWAYHLARQAESGEEGMRYLRITAADAVAAGVIKPAEVEDARRRLPDAVFRELFEAQPTDDEGNPFGIDHIRACVAELSAAEPVAWGWDLGKARDWTVGVGVDAQGMIARFLRWQLIPWPETEARIARAVGSTAGLVDATGLGDPIVDHLQRAGAPVEGRVFTAGEKQRLMELLAVAIQARKIRFPAGPIVSELESYEYQYYRGGVRYSAPDGLHDDCVCALALAWDLAESMGVPWGEQLGAKVTEPARDEMELIIGGAGPRGEGVGRRDLL